jgi:hypothetical protein
LIKIIIIKLLTNVNLYIYEYILVCVGRNVNVCWCMCNIAGHSDRALRYELSSDAGIVGSNPTGGMDVSMCVYSVFVLSCV